MLLELGGSILRFSGAMFDFAINHIIINFKDTLDTQMHLMPIINGGWTFFRDLANILIIGIFVFIAISLILGLTEYGQKKLIARVLIIAVLLNFSLLFTKIIIDASNFAAYTIYSQTAGAAPAAGGPVVFSIAEKILKPLHISGTWDTSDLAKAVYNQSEFSGSLKALAFGLFGFLILATLSVVILYGAFLIIARAIMFILLMLTAPLAYATYLSPHFEASQFGWGNWWKALINNAAFAPLFMMFLSVSILIMQSSAGSIGPGNTLGAFDNDPMKQVLADGWHIIFAYILGTGLLFTSIRLSSSLAGSISGVKIGQMAAGIPLAFGTRGAARLAQLSIGRASQAASDATNKRMQTAKLRAIQTQDPKDWDKVERLRKLKSIADKGAHASFNPLNTNLGKAAAGSAGLAGVLAGEKKSSFAGSAEERAKNLEQKAKAILLTQSDKDAIRKKASDEIQATNNKNAENAAKGLEVAKTALEQAHKEKAAADDPTLNAAADKQVVQNSIEKAPALDAAQREVEIHDTRKTQMEASHGAEINIMMQKAQQANGADKDNQLRAVATRKAEHAEELQKQAANITAARAKVDEITSEIKAPRAALTKRQQKAAQEILNRTEEAEQAAIVSNNKKAIAEAKPRDADVNKKYRERLDEAEKGVKEGIQQVVQRDVNLRGGGHEAEHIIQHHMDETYKSTSNSKRLLDRLEKIEKNEEKNPSAGGEHA